MGAWMSVAIGAAFGAWVRWQLSLWLASAYWLVWGTLVANAIGGFLVGMVLAITQHYPNFPPMLRLLIATGFLGGLTTFSTFSAETFVLLQKAQYFLASLQIVVHVFISVFLTCVGFYIVNKILS